MTNLAALRKAKNLTQEALARAISVSNSTIQNLERGKSKTSRMDLLHAVKIARVLGCRPEDLLDEEEPENG